MRNIRPSCSGLAFFALLARWLLIVLLVGGWGIAVPAVGAQAPTDNPGELSFERMGMAEQRMTGPFDAAYFDFSLPATWQLEGAARLDLALNVFFNSAIQPFGGSLTVQLNGTTLETVLLNRTGDQEVRIPIAPAALVSPRSDGRHSLSLQLDTSEECNSDKITTVIVRPRSRLVLPHRITPPPTDLSQLPRPIYQRSFRADAATIVVPDAPSAAELQAAMSVATGFGRMSGGGLALTLTPLAQLDAAQRAAHDLIFVGTPAGLPLLAEAQLPAPVQGGRFVADGLEAEDGVVQLIASPWNAERVVLVVGGNQPPGVVKAAQAVSSGALRPQGRRDLALIAGVQPQAVTNLAQSDQTLAKLGYATQRLVGLGGQYAGYQFTLPAGQVVGDEAYLDLMFVHTALLDYDQSGLTISLNDEPVASVRLDDNSTRPATVRIVFPATALRAGTNILTMRADLLPRAICTDPRGSGLWMVIRAESLLHLGLSTTTTGETAEKLDLARYPRFFTTQPNLSDLALVLPKADPVAWQVAAGLMSDMGSQMQGTMADLVLTFGDVISPELRNERNLLLVGRPDSLPVLQELQPALPAPFAPGAVLADEPGAAVRYREGATVSRGYLQLLAAPWASKRAILAVLGSTDEGLRWAGATLTTPAQRGALRGNLAVIQGVQVENRDTRPTAIPSPPATTPTSSAQNVQVESRDTRQTPTPQPTTVAEAGASPAQAGSSRLLLIAGVVGLVLLAITVATAFFWWRRRRSEKSEV